jgi:hypothetical protein
MAQVFVEVGVVEQDIDHALTHTFRVERLSSDIRFWSSGDTKTGPPVGLLMGA